MSKYMNYLMISCTFKYCNMKKSLLRFSILLIFLVFSCNLLEKDKSKEETSNVENKSDFSIASSLIGLNKNKENKTREEQNIQQKEQTRIPDKVYQSSEDTKDKSQDNQPTKSTDKEQQNNLLQEPSNISEKLQDSTLKAPEISKPLQTPSPSLIIPTPISNPIVSTSTMTTNPIESKTPQEIASSLKTNESNVQEIKFKAVSTLLSTLSESENLEESYDEDVCFIIKKDTNNDVFIGIFKDSTECNRNYDDSDTVPLLKIEKSEIDKFKQAMLNGIDFNAKRYFNASQGKFENHNENITVRYQDAYDSYNAEEKTTYIFLDLPSNNRDYSFNDYSFAIKKSEFEKIQHWFEKL